MSELGWTIVGAIILMALVVAALGIGYLLTGKSRLKKGCGFTPVEKGKKGTTSCPICGADKVCDKKEDEDEHDSDKS